MSAESVLCACRKKGVMNDAVKPGYTPEEASLQTVAGAVGEEFVGIPHAHKYPLPTHFLCFCNSPGFIKCHKCMCYMTTARHRLSWYVYMGASAPARASATSTL